MHATDPRLRLAVLASGRGSNLQAIIDEIAGGRLRAEVVGVFSDRPQAPALQKVDVARRWSANPRDFADRKAFDAALGDALAAVQPDWIICAGYMRILGEPLVHRFAGRMLNIHPSLLPKYRGLHTHARALEAGDTEHGASVHLVVPELDAGSVIAQARVPVLPGDSAEQLAARVLAREHPLLLATLALLASGRLRVDRDAVHVDGQCLFTPLRLESADTALA
ncbi:phosphoribosylglycinamide formyltransferase [Xanthomonas vesicatoria ATCC 35937]|uniref:Phosphoribosylglycinamide formyltransferase n=1 Tax=Xanthomonas vesicatoria ATCC 35937 TaxID=925775 RepID=F0BEN6_9XANT|nr:phosphoribosylglycinamide formyltransferase [Xanthomonas vesicatoria]APP74832.1 phosphoribosylglycinamide formyltransferase [Xanthomonas vesicatoria ATCC 35937]EGD09076.1 formyltetrahydrofolate-dependent phosphoribosylglycinamide formyltransferase [Xanthomonas vesicatoria ATCC 35937]KTF30173.1 phosphoribosylglycinamide formyltransferase [Xanthomonas vesicatoria]MCC8597585.1 phosphoribosylglycinamide formyltransferase [Xanthomonas vesicatoria]MCC8605945.1 phosphoribosylglycinamide formyltran